MGVVDKAVEVLSVLVNKGPRQHVTVSARQQQGGKQGSRDDQCDTGEAETRF